MTRTTAVVAADNAAVVARLSIALSNPDLCDVVLQSDSDGSTTPASTLFLAACSPVLRNMLTGAFAEGAARGRKRPLEEGAAPPVRSPFSREVVATVLSFAATNDAPALWTGSTQLLSEILEASEYYDIAGLKEKVGGQLFVRAKEVPAEACGVLEAVWGGWEAGSFGSGCAGKVGETALSVIDGAADVALLGCGCLCEAAMEKVLGLKFIGFGEAEIFNALKRWVDVDAGNRIVAGGRLVSYVSLSLLSPSFLTGVVEKSGLVSKEAMSDLFRTLLMKAEKDGGIPRGDGKLPNWASTFSTDFKSNVTSPYRICSEVLDCRLRDGHWVWELEVEKAGHFFYVGLATGPIDPSEFLGAQRHGHAFGGDGSCSFLYSDGSLIRDEESWPSFSDNDTVRLVLNCGTGSLSIKVNGRAPFEAFTGIELYGDANAFRPVVSLGCESRVRLLKFSRIRT